MPILGTMLFPPPIRVSAPLLALIFGLMATFLDYRLNLSLDLTRHLSEVRERAESSGSRLAEMSRQRLAAGQPDLLQAEVAAIPDVSIALDRLIPCLCPPAYGYR